METLRRVLLRAAFTGILFALGFAIVAALDGHFGGAELLTIAAAIAFATGFAVIPAALIELRATRLPQTLARDATAAGLAYVLGIPLVAVAFFEGVYVATMMKTHDFMLAFAEVRRYVDLAREPRPVAALFAFPVTIAVVTFFQLRRMEWGVLDAPATFGVALLAGFPILAAADSAPALHALLAAATAALWVGARGGDAVAERVTRRLAAREETA